ncbi:hypothetical protein V1522DRAFT_412525 [Lipomyces starkeyi]
MQILTQNAESVTFGSLGPSCFGSSDADVREDRLTISIDDNFQQVHGKDISPISEPEPEYFCKFQF